MLFPLHFKNLLCPDYGHSKLRRNVCVLFLHIKEKIKVYHFRCFKCINKQLVHQFPCKAVPHSSRLGVFVAFIKNS